MKMTCGGILFLDKIHNFNIQRLSHRRTYSTQKSNEIPLLIITKFINASHVPFRDDNDKTRYGIFIILLCHKMLGFGNFTGVFYFTPLYRARNARNVFYPTFQVCYLVGTHIERNIKIILLQSRPPSLTRFACSGRLRIPYPPCSHARQRAACSLRRVWDSNP